MDCGDLEGEGFRRTRGGVFQQLRLRQRDPCVAWGKTVRTGTNVDKHSELRQFLRLMESVYCDGSFVANSALLWTNRTVATSAMAVVYLQDFFNQANKKK